MDGWRVARCDGGHSPSRRGGFVERRDGYSVGCARKKKEEEREEERKKQMSGNWSLCSTKGTGWKSGDRCSYLQKTRPVYAGAGQVGGHGPGGLRIGPRATTSALERVSFVIDCLAARAGQQECDAKQTQARPARQEKGLWIDGGRVQEKRGARWLAFWMRPFGLVRPQSFYRRSCPSPSCCLASGQPAVPT